MNSLIAVVRRNLILGVITVQIAFGTPYGSAWGVACYEVVNSDQICMSISSCVGNAGLCQIGSLIACGAGYLSAMGLECEAAAGIGDTICNEYTTNPGNVVPPAEQFLCGVLFICKKGTQQCPEDPNKKLCTSEVQLVSNIYHWIQEGGAVCQGN